MSRYRTRTDDQRSVNPSKGPGVDSTPGVGDLGGDVDGGATLRGSNITTATAGTAGANKRTLAEVEAAKRKIVTGS